MRIAFATIGSLLILYVLLRYERGHKRLSIFFDELWIKIDDGVTQRQRICLTWIDKTKLVSLHIIDLFFEKQSFSCKNFLSSFVFMRMTMFFHLALLCTTFVIRYGASIKTCNFPYGLTFFIPCFDEISIVPLSLSFNGLSVLHIWIIALGFLLVVFLLLCTRYLIHKYSLWIGATIVTVLTVLDVCFRWNNTGVFITYQDHFGNLLANEFTPYSIGIKIIIYAIDIIILPLLLMLSVYALRRIFSSKKTLHYVIHLIIAIILWCLLFCYCVLFGFLANLQGWQWVVGCAGFLPDIFAPTATLAIMIAAAIGMIFLLIGLLHLANRNAYIIPKYRFFENDTAFLSIGGLFLLISLSGKLSIKEIIKSIIDKFL